MEGMQAFEIKASVLANLEVREADPAALYRNITQGEFYLDATILGNSPPHKVNACDDRYIRGDDAVARCTSRGAIADSGPRC